MITRKAMIKINNAMMNGEIKREKIEGLAIMIAASNILITDYNKKGELIFEDIKVK